MLDVFSDVKSIVNANRCGVSIDSAVFRLHWRFTAFLLISASAILTARQYGKASIFFSLQIPSFLSQNFSLLFLNFFNFCYCCCCCCLLLLFLFFFTFSDHHLHAVGEPIDCLLDTFVIPASMINTYCWVTSTFLVPSALDDPHAPYSGVDNSPQRMFEQLRTDRSRDHENDRQYYPYYQWIGFALLGQGACFYIPHYFWARAEGGLLRSLVQGLFRTKEGVART